MLRMMYTVRKCVLPLLVISLFGYTCALRVESCSRNKANDLATVNFVDLRPDPVQVPGSMSLAVTVTLNQPIKGQLDADMTISRRFGLLWIDLPCVNTPFGKVGSCSYPDICNNIMSNTTTPICPKLLSDNKIPCHCNVPAGKYTVGPTVIPLSLATLGISLPTVMGDYQAMLRVTDRSTMQEIYCLSVNVEIEDPPTTSTFGNIGRFFVNLFG